MLTPLGKFLRKLRIDRGWLLKEMAEGVGVTPAFLSGVETGRKSAPASLIDKIIAWAQLASTDEKKIKQLAEHSRREFKVGLPSNSNGSDLEAAALLARFGELPVQDREHIRKILVRRFG